MDRPWVDDRTCTLARGNTKSWLSLENIQKAIEEMNSVNYPSRYHFFTAPVAKLVTDEECIEYFKGTGVVVVDRNGNEWLNGEPLKGE